MSALPNLLNFVVTTLQTWPLSQKVKILQTHQFSDVQFALKVRATLASGDTLQVHLYRNGDHTDYAYHLISRNPIRWDNKEHFRDLPSYPHHFHNKMGKVEASPP